ncbi:MAG: prepilin peptidase [Planctomycetes bacterium]|nr:prepilin peptidase [Planctomycetota bacterium]
MPSDLNVLELLVVFFFGSCLGSFANVCIYRLPLDNLSPLKGRSMCPNCKSLVKWYLNIPIISYIVLLGRCAVCKWRIPIRYLIVEFAMGTLFTLHFLQLGSPLNTDILLLMTGFYVIFTSIVNSYVDIDYMILPDEITISGIFISFAIALGGWFASMRTYVSITESGLGIILGIGILFGIRIIGEIIFKKEAMGLGDVKYMGMLGGLFGYKAVPLILLIACLFGMVVGLVYKFVYKKSYIPFGPFLAIAAVIVLFFGIVLSEIVMDLIHGQYN